MTPPKAWCVSSSNLSIHGDGRVQMWRHWSNTKACGTLRPSWRTQSWLTEFLTEVTGPVPIMVVVFSERPVCSLSDVHTRSKWCCVLVSELTFPFPSLYCNKIMIVSSSFPDAKYRRVCMARMNKLIFDFFENLGFKEKSYNFTNYFVSFLLMLICP